MIVEHELAERLAAHERVERLARIRAVCCDEHPPDVDLDAHALAVFDLSLDGPGGGPRRLAADHHAARTRELLERTSRR